MFKTSLCWGEILVLVFRQYVRHVCSCSECCCLTTCTASYLVSVVLDAMPCAVYVIIFMHSAVYIFLKMKFIVLVIQMTLSVCTKMKIKI